MAVLLHPQLLRLVCEFQDGVFADLLQIPLRSFDEKACVYFMMDAKHHTLAFLANFHDTYAPWLRLHPTERDVGRLLRCRPHLHDVIAAHAAMYGQLYLLQSLQPLQLPFLLKLAASNGQTDAVRLLVSKGCTTCSSESLDGAARNGHLQVLEFLDETFSDTARCTTDAMDLAAMNGHLNVVKFLQTKRREGCTHWAIDMAAANGHLEVVRFLHENGAPATIDAMNRAARNGHLKVVQFLHYHRLEGGTARAMDWAAMNGHLEVVKFLHQNRLEGCTTCAMDDAACFGHLEVVKFLHEHRQEGCTTFAMNYAATNGFLDVVRYLHEHRAEGCTSLAVNQASRNGHKEVVRFLRARYPEPCGGKWTVRIEEICAGVLACSLVAWAIVV
ncbi:unnamed protein product [Aphanomyces euteiches]